MLCILPFLLVSSGCASLPTRPEPPAAASIHEPGRSVLAEVPPVRQSGHQCGAAALEAVLRYWQADASAPEISRALSSKRARGALNISLAPYARRLGFWAQMQSSDPDRLKAWVRRGVPPVVMLHVGPLGTPFYHFAVVVGFDDRRRLYTLQAGRGVPESIGYGPFDARWGKSGRWALVLCPPERVDWELSARQEAELALLFEKRGDPEAAARRYEAAARKEPDNDLIWFNLANAQMKAGRLAEARVLYESLAPRHPAWGELHNNLAWTRLQEGDGQRAAEGIRAAFRNGARPRYDALDTLGLALCRLRQCGRAQACFLKAAARAPRKGPAAGIIRAHLDECLRGAG